MDDVIFGNSCVSGWVYTQMGKVYNNPFIWHYFQDGMDYIKVCKNFDYYLNQEPILISEDLKDGRYPYHPKISKDYPIMKLGDVNVHFIHHTDGDEVVDKYLRRRDRLTEYNLIPVAWDTELKTQDVIDQFKLLDNAILVSGAKVQVDAAKMIVKAYNG